MILTMEVIATLMHLSAVISCGGGGGGGGGGGRRGDPGQGRGLCRDYLQNLYFLCPSEGTCQVKVRNLPFPLEHNVPQLYLIPYCKILPKEKIKIMHVFKLKSRKQHSCKNLRMGCRYSFSEQPNKATRIIQQKSPVFSLG